MSLFGWSSKRRREREASERERQLILDALSEVEEELPSPTRLIMHREMDRGQLQAQAFPAPSYLYHNDPYGYYRFTPQYFGSVPQPSSAAGAGPSQAAAIPQEQMQKQPKVDFGAQTKEYQPVKSQEGPIASHPLPYHHPYAHAYPGYGYYPYPAYAPTAYGPVAHPLGPMPANQPPSDDEEEWSARTGIMNVEGRRPLFLVALFVVSIAVLLVSFPLTLLSAGYIGPLGLMFATGPFATVFAFWAIYLTPCECYPNIEWATSRIRVFATTAAVFDAVGTIGVPISMYGAQCPDDDDQMLGCEDELPAAKGVSLAVAVILGTHCFLCLLVRSNARKLAESKFGDERTEGITLTPTPFNRK